MHVLMNIICDFGLMLFLLSALFLGVGFFGMSGKRLSKYCTEMTIGTVISVHDEARSDTGVYFYVAYEAEGKQYAESVPLEHTEGIPLNVSPGTEVIIWYNKKDPTTLIISYDQEMNATAESWKRSKKRWIRGMLIGLVMIIIYGIYAY